MSRRRWRRRPGSRAGGAPKRRRSDLVDTNLEIVRGLYEAFRRRDNESPFEVFDEGIVWDASTVHMPGWEATGLFDVFRGHAGVRRYWRQWLDAWSEIEFKYELIELEDGRIAAVIDQRNRARHSGMWLDQQRYAQVWTLRGGKVVRMEFADPEEIEAG
jgi:ketosteroid isomerase-like protein